MAHDSWILAVTEHGQWRLGIGDPTPIGWFTVFAYLLADLSCVFNWKGELRARRLGVPANPSFWLVLSILLLLLGINKQLDLQTLLQNVGRQLSKDQGWYMQRRQYQVLFIGSLCAAGILAITALAWSVRNQLKRSILALIGVVFLYVFVMVRATSIHHLDAFLASGPLGIRWNWILELGGIAIVGIGALLAWRSRNRSMARRGRSRDSRDTTGARRYTFVRGVLVLLDEGDRRPD